MYFEKYGSALCLKPGMLGQLVLFFSFLLVCEGFKLGLLKTERIVLNNEDINLIGLKSI